MRSSRRSEAGAEVEMTTSQRRSRLRSKEAKEKEDRAKNRDMHAADISKNFGYTVYAARAALARHNDDKDAAVGALLGG